MIGGARPEPFGTPLVFALLRRSSAIELVFPESSVVKVCLYWHLIHGLSHGRM